MDCSTLTTPRANLVASINEAHSACCQAAGDALNHAMRCGDLLSEAKLGCQHGSWLTWLTENFDGSPRTARLYMQLSVNRDKIESKRQDLAVLGVEQAMQLVATPRLESNGTVHVSQNTGAQEWYTPPDIIDAARACLGGIDLDPASSDAAQQTVQATTYFTIDDDGLAQDWKAKTVWLNPPYASGVIDKFIDKLCESYQAKSVRTAIVLVNNATETKWFQLLASQATSICFPASRVKFLDTDGDPTGAPLQGQAIIYLGTAPKKFQRSFSRFGVITGMEGQQ